MDKKKTSHQVTLLFCLTYATATVAMLVKKQFVWSAVFASVGVLHFLAAITVIALTSKKKGR
ncbi:MAG: hypothetical protein HYT15_02490 [Candidatus Magasanikbacteria bacterium]|nr:hypothetical protein [Candidatus Magasanikbacteria bacterium]